MRWRIFILAFALLLWSYKGSNNDAFAQNWRSQETVELVFCGDVMQHLPQVRAATAAKAAGAKDGLVSACEPNAVSSPTGAGSSREAKCRSAKGGNSAQAARPGRNSRPSQPAEVLEASGPDYRYCFEQVAPLWQGADFVVANLETTLAESGFSGYPRFVSPWQLARDLRLSGIGVLVTANNHCCDNGAPGIDRTIDWLDSLGIAHTGTWRDSAQYRAQSPLMLSKGPFRIALLNYTYDTNGMPIPQGRVVALLDTAAMARDIRAARERNATNIVAFLHWGEEYRPTPSATQRELAAWLHSRGVDIVVGSHPHVVEPAQYCVDGVDTTGVTVYSLGNFISNQRKERTCGGICVRLRITADSARCHYRLDYWNNYVSMNFRGRSYVVIPETMLDSLPSGQRDEFRRLVQQQDQTVGLKGVQTLTVTPR